MRLLHTSDWHLGRSFHRESLLDAQAAFLDHLITTVRTERVDVVLVSGDLYDRALPPVEAVRLFDDALRRIHATGARAVLIGGNHDSLGRIDYASGLIDAAGIHVRGSPDNLADPVMIEDDHGPVAFYPIPYLEPDLLRYRWDLTERSHEAALGHAMRRIHADLARRPAHTRSVVLSHAFVTGGSASDSERDISVGGATHVPASLFDGVDYAALGHLHGSQRMRPHVRYSGSPLAYSFSEENDTKGSWLVDLGPGGVTATEFIPAPVWRPIARISGRIEDLLSEPAWEYYTGHWLQVTVTDPVRPTFPMDRLRERFPHTLHLDFAPDGDGEPPDRTWAQRVTNRSERELALDFVSWARGADPTEEEQRLLQTAFDDINRREVTR